MRPVLENLVPGLDFPMRLSAADSVLPGVAAPDGVIVCANLPIRGVAPGFACRGVHATSCDPMTTRRNGGDGVGPERLRDREGRSPTERKTKVPECKTRPSFLSRSGNSSTIHCRSLQAVPEKFAPSYGSTQYGPAVVEMGLCAVSASGLYSGLIYAATLGCWSRPFLKFQ